MPTTTRLTPKLRSAVRWLRQHYPTKHRVTIRVIVPRDGMHGEFVPRKGSSLIRLCADTDAVMLDTLLEEYAHHLRNETPISWDDDDHDAIFWAILGRITKHWRGE